MEIEKLKPCPFCGANPIRLEGDGRWCQIGCDGCGGRGTEHPNNWEAAERDWNRRSSDQPVDSSPLLPPWFDIVTAPKNGATILGMYAAKESYLGDDGPRHHIVRWFDSEQAFCTSDGRGEPERQPNLTHWQPLTYLHALYGHTVYPVPGAYYAYDLPTEWKATKRETVDLWQGAKAMHAAGYTNDLAERDGFIQEEYLDQARACAEAWNLQWWRGSDHD